MPKRMFHRCARHGDIWVGHGMDGNRASFGHANQTVAEVLRSQAIKLHPLDHM